MTAVILSIWMLNPLTHHYEFVEKGKYTTPIECAQAARAMNLQTTWSCVYTAK